MSLALIGVREYPRLTETTIVTTPTGTRHRWAEDEPDAANAPTDSSHGSTAPGGYSNWTATLPRKPGSDYGDVAPLSDVEILDAAGDIIFSGRLDEAPKVSGDQMSVTPQAVGHQALLEDEQGINFLGVDPRPGEWGTAAAKRKYSLGFSRSVSDMSVLTDALSPAIQLELEGPWAQAAWVEAVYTSPDGNGIGRIIWSYESVSDAAGQPSTSFDLYTGVADDPEWTNQELSASLHTAAAGSGSSSFVPTTPRRCAVVAWRYAGANMAEGRKYTAYFRATVIGNHNLTLYPSISGTDGLLASDIITYALNRWAPSIKPRNVQQSDFVIPISVMEDVTVADIIADCNRFQLWNWAVWEKKSFDYAPIGYLGRRWKARTGPSQLRETGQTAKRIRNGVIVHYTDVDGTTKSVGPPGSGAHTIESDLLDPDPLNPANQAGIRMWESISMKGYGTTASATQVGREYLRQIRQLDRSGEAVIVGWIEDPSGNLHPHTSVRANDVIEFVDSSDPSPRLIVEAQHSRAARETRITLDAPRDAMEAITDRLQVVVEGVVS